MSDSIISIVTEGLQIPQLSIVADNLPKAWEDAVAMTWKNGVGIDTQYDAVGDPLSKDVVASITVRDPFAEPRIHRAFPGGLVELETYRQEVVDGIHDHWVNPEEGKWEYTYHERLTAYEIIRDTKPVELLIDPEYVQINQIDYIVEALATAPHTRRAQAITWKPWEDAGISDPACLQRIWCRIVGDRLVMNVHMRSNDAFKAAFMNMYAFTALQKEISTRVSTELGREIKPGQYTHIADSFHIYGSYFTEFEGFLETLSARSFADRTFRSDDEMVVEIFAEAREAIAASIEDERLTGRKGL